MEGIVMDEVVEAEVEGLKIIFNNGSQDPWRHESEQTSSPDNYCLEVISRLGFIESTPIQSQGWTMALKGRDFIGIAEADSGKTLAYLLSAMVHVSAQPQLDMVKELTGCYKIRYHANGPIEIDFTPPFKKSNILLELEKGAKFSIPRDLFGQYANKYLLEVEMSSGASGPEPKIYLA
ncbi:hypothetical protein FXO38_27160 [Capsicum annuum]|nr:hypothetical protein FXO38_27160 [Capsicum annuum]KAF3648045.1 hypothetical protein FXO37_19646 [Capsicum annuum]